MLGLGMTGKSCECGAQGEGCWVRSQGGLYIAMELDHFTVVKGNKFASLAPKVGSVSEIHISHKRDVLPWVSSGLVFGSYARD